MSISIPATKDTLANDYAALAPYGTLFTADPGTSGAATNEVSGGSPAFARKSMAWSTSSGGAGSVSGSPTFDIPAGTTITNMGVCASSTLTTADVKDKCAITSQTFASQGTYQPSTSFTQA
jgi:hypothetical protein